MARADKKDLVPGMIVMDYENETATFYLGRFKKVDGKTQFEPERRYFQEADTNYEPLRIKQLPLKFSDLVRTYPQQGDEKTRQVPFFLPERKFSKGARAYIRAKREEIERKSMESQLRSLSDEDL